MTGALAAAVTGGVAGGVLGSVITCAVMLRAISRKRPVTWGIAGVAHAAVDRPVVVATPPPLKVKVALCQINVIADKQHNIGTARAAVEGAAAEGAQLVVLPECWNSPYSNDSFPSYAEDIEGGNAPSVSAMAETAAKCGITLVAGSIPERRGNSLYNTCCVFDKSGAMIGKYSKCHLFDIDIPGKITFKESATLTPGDGPLVVDTPAGRLGIGICYDIRFPELASVYAQRGVQMIVYPGAFNTVTGPAHWELLQRCRAVDNQLFVATCSPARTPDGQGYQAWGHSTLVGPFGEVLATTEHSPATVVVEVDYSALVERRQNMQLMAQRRYDLYTMVDKTRA